MKTSPSTSLAVRLQRVAQRAFSLIEIMIAVGLLTVIVLGLLAMFNQTQRAFKTSMTNTDVGEAGRAFVEMLRRELEQVTPSHMAYTTNFLAEVSPSFDKPLFQALPGSATRRTNIVQRFFFLDEVNQDWVGIGYQVIPDFPNAGVGTLYRFSTNSTKYNVRWLPNAFLQAPLTNLSRIADGIVHLRVRAFDTNGILLDPNNWPRGVQSWPRGGTNWWVGGDLPDQVNYQYFISNSVPAYLELELGILEPQVLDRYRAIGSGDPATVAAQRNYLSNHAAQVHIFRQRIPIRNVDFTAYK